MRTSATGDPERLRLADERGFTLVELLIVLTIIGLMSAAVVLAMPDGRTSLRTDAESFAARLKAAQDHAVIEARPVAVTLSATGYVFEKRAGREWQALRREPFLAGEWSDGTQALVPDEGLRIVFDSTGIVEPAELALERDGGRTKISIGHDGRIDVAI